MFDGAAVDCEVIEGVVWVMENLDPWADPGVADDSISEATNPVGDDAPTYHMADEQESMFVGDALRVCNVFASASEAPRDLAPNIVIDSGASATVCSLAYIESRFPNFRQELSPGAKSFKFGDSRRFSSLGRLILSGYIRVRTPGENAPTTAGNAGSRHLIHIMVDLVDSHIPSLLPNKTLNRTKASLDFEHQVLKVPTMGLIDLDCTGSGRIDLPFQPWKISGPGEINASTKVFMTQSEGLGMDKNELFKLHVHLGHAPAPQMIALLKLSNRAFSEKAIGDLIRECGCTSPRESNFKAVANTHTSPFPGYCVFIDVIYPKPMSGHSLPFLMIVYAFSRFVICTALGNLKPEHAIWVFGKSRVAFLGTPVF